MIAIGIIIPVLTLIVKLFDNYKKWLKHISPKHSKEWWIMVVVNIPSIVVFTMESKLIWYFAAPLSGAMIAFFLWLFFDGIYNLLRKYNFWFTGSDDKDDPKSDNFLQSIPVWLQAVIKIGGLALFLTLYIYYL